MNDPTQSLEDRLAKGYADQVGHYDRALRVVNRQQASANRDEDWVAELQRILDEVRAIDAAIANDKLAWQQAKRTPGERLGAILKILEQRIRGLGEIVDRQIAALKAKRQQLAPELDGFIRQRRMLKAYDQYGQSARSRRL